MQTSRTLLGIGVVLAAMSVSSAALAQPAVPVGAFDRDAWVQGILKLKSHNSTAFQVLPALIELYPDEAFGVVEGAWPQVQHEGVKTGILKAFEFSGHPRVLDVLDLGIEDPDLKVRRYAFNYVAGYAFEDLAEDYAGYSRWRDAARGRQVPEVTAEACRRFVKKLNGASGETQAILVRALQDHADNLGRFPEVRNAAIDEGILEILAPWLEEPKPDSDRVRAAQGALSALRPPETYVRSVLMPLGSNSSLAEVRTAVANIIRSKEYAAMAQDYVVGRLMEETDGSLLNDLAQCLATYGDPSTIPLVIGIIDAVPGYDTVYGLGYFALTPLTGVQYDESHDGTWWRAWWERNRSQFSESVRAIDIPDLKGKVAFAPKAEDDPVTDVRDVPAQDLRAAQNDNMRYFLIGASDKVPADGYKLIVTIPGGDGSAEMHPFMRRVWKNALGNGYLVAQLVAKEWSPGQFEKIVWPIEVNRWDGMAFSTEGFAKTVVEETRSKYTVDARHIYLFAWSSGGPAAYAALLQDDSPFAGAFIAMSIFNESRAPSLQTARGKAVYLLSSPDDKIIPMWMPENARDKLTRNGAIVKLDTYKGGHGWQGDVYGMIRTGIEWLNTNTGNPQNPTP